MKPKFFTTSDDIKLAYSDKYVSGSKLSIILVHGLAEHMGRYDEFINRLNDAGISVFTIDLRGHGQSGGKRGDIKSFDDYLNDMDAFVRHIKKTDPELKLALFGHSIGGLIAINYTAKSDLIDLLVLSSPSIETPKAVNLLRIFPNKLLHKIRIKKRHSESAEMLTYSRNDPYACHRFTLGLLKVVFIDGIKRTKNNIGKIKMPVLLLGGRGDPLVNSGKFEKVLGEFSSKDKTLNIYKNAKHRIVQNDAKDVAIPDIINWLKSRI